VRRYHQTPAPSGSFVSQMVLRASFNCTTERCHKQQDNSHNACQGATRSGVRALEHGFDGLAAGRPEQRAKLDRQRVANRIAAEEEAGDAHDNQEERPQ
jgi:hypothetical protein